MNISLLYLIFGLLLFLTIYKQRKCWYFIWQLNGWRGLIQQPILWLLLLLYLEPKSLMSTIQRCHKYFQFPLAIVVFNRILLYVDDPETMESILTAPECLNKTFLQNGFYANKGLLHARDEQWKIRRKQLNPAFSHNTLVSFFEVFNRVANDLSQKISKDMQDFEVNFKTIEDLITRAVLETSCLTTMGHETNFLQHDKQNIAQAYRYLMELTALRILRPWYQIDVIFRLLDYENYEKSKKANMMVQDFVAKIVQQKYYEWQHKLKSVHQKPDISRDFAATLTKGGASNDEQTLRLNEQGKIHNLTANMNSAATAANDVLKNIIENVSSLPDIDANAFMQRQEQQRQHRIFIEQMFYLAQTGKLTLEDIMNESQSMVVVSFETVSSCIINALLCLAINHESQMRLRHEIKQMFKLSKEKTKNKMKKKLTTKTSINTTCSNTIDNDLDFDFAREAAAQVEVADKGDVNNDCSGYNNSPDDSDDNDVGNGDDDDDEKNDWDVPIIMEQLLNMPYLDMIINESLRLLTTVPMNLRNVSADFQLNVIQRDKCSAIVGESNNDICNSSSKQKQHHQHHHHRSVIVPKDTMIALDTFNMQRNTRYWGENALKFYPEHFSKKQQKQQQNLKVNENEEKLNETSIPLKTAGPATSASDASSRHSYAFIPFSKGLRTCIGYRYSLYLSKIVLIKLISSFHFSTNIQLEDLECYESVSLKFHNADKIQFQIQAVGSEGE